MQEIKKVLEAVLLIERKGVDAAKTAIDLVGKDIAVALIIAQIRNELTTYKYLPFDKEIEIEIRKILKDNNLI